MPLIHARPKKLSTEGTVPRCKGIYLLECELISNSTSWRCEMACRLMQCTSPSMRRSAGIDTPIVNGEAGSVKSLLLVMEQYSPALPLMTLPERASHQRMLALDDAAAAP